MADSKATFFYNMYSTVYKLKKWSEKKFMFQSGEICHDKVETIVQVKIESQAKVQPAKGRSFVRSHISRSINGRTFAYRQRQKCDPN